MSQQVSRFWISVALLVMGGALMAAYIAYPSQPHLMVMGFTAVIGSLVVTAQSDHR